MQKTPSKPLRGKYRLMAINIRNYGVSVSSACTPQCGHQIASATFANPSGRFFFVDWKNKGLI
tara:strand:+ start:1363 stop:1551 length:189 start_codon:yes stop_codon:yes gene_type:complete